MMRVVTRTVLYAVGCLCFAGPAVADTCVRRDPIPKPIAVSPYRDHEAFVQSTRPVRHFVEVITRAGDAAMRGEGGADCAVENLAAWAAADALTSPPDDFEGYRQLIRYSFSLNIAAGKLAMSGVAIDRKTMDWLERLSLIVSRYFAKHYRSRGSADNLYVWSGAAAATYLLLRGNEELAKYQDDVWRNAIAAINDDGIISQELRRKAQALPYHTYNLSAILWLERMRQSLGIKSTSADQARITRLKSLIEATLCSESRVIEGQPMPQNVPSFTSAGSVSALDPSFWRVIHGCGVLQVGDFYNMLGGSMQASLRYIERARQSGR